MRRLRWILPVLAAWCFYPRVYGQTVEDRARQLIQELIKEPEIVIVEDEVQAGQLNGPSGPHANYNVTTKVEPGSPEYKEKVAALREKRRRDIQAKLVELGPPAVPVICNSLANQGMPYREYLSEALARIGDMRAVPCLIDYMTEGMTKLRYAQTLEKAGETELAEANRREGGIAVRSSLASLEALTGQNFGADPARWQDWWNKNKNYFTTP